MKIASGIGNEGKGYKRFAKVRDLLASAKADRQRVGKQVEMINFVIVLHVPGCLQRRCFALMACPPDAVSQPTMFFDHE
jgi:hypothetical protein